MHRVRDAEITAEKLTEWTGNDEPFESAHLRGEPNGTGFAGELTGVALSAYLDDCRRGRVTYVIVSHGTPICWRTARGWIACTDTITAGIGRHQALVLRAFRCSRPQQPPGQRPRHRQAGAA